MLRVWHGWYGNLRLRLLDHSKCYEFKVTKFAAGGSEFCGRALADGLDTAGAAKTTEDAAATVCSKVTPFGVRFLSDGYEFSAMEDATDAKGFKLIYNQVDC